MAFSNKIDSNSTGLSIAEEDSLGVVSPTAVWRGTEPNSYSDFGQQVTNVARNPIVSDRQRQKGLITDLDASGGFSHDLTQEVLPFLAQGAFFADIRDKNELSITNVDGTTEDFDPAGGTGGDGYAVGDLLFGSGFTNAANNGLHEVSAAAAGAVTVTSDLVDETPPADAVIRRVGFQFAAGDLDVNAATDFATLTTTTKDFTELGLIPGEWIFIGGDTAGAAGNQFLTAANNGFKRVRSVAANELVLDKSAADMVTEASAAETVQIFFAPRVLKNEADTSLQNCRSYQLERTLGAPDTDFPAQIQAEYLKGAVANQLQLNIATADKMTFDLSYIGTDVEFIDGPTALKPDTGGASRLAAPTSEAYNSSNDVRRVNLSVVSSSDEAPEPLYAFVQEMSLTVDNNLSANKAVGVFGAFAMTAGMFAVSGSITAYFSDVAAQLAIRNNADVTLDAHLVKANQGISIDLPLITLGDGRPNVDSDQAIVLPLTFEAATGRKVDPDLNHTMMMMWWDYLPDAAE